MTRETMGPQIPGEVFRQLEIEKAGEFASIFPGQGGQEVGMGRDLCGIYPKVAKLYEDAEKVLGYSPLDLTEVQLKETRFAQPAIFVYSEACRIAFTEQRKAAGLKEVRPKFYAGNSLGEFNALLAAGAFNLKDGLGLVKVRADAMQKACEENPGGLYAIVIPTAGEIATKEEKEFARELREHLNDPQQGLYPEAVNSDTQFVVGGLDEDLERMRGWFKDPAFSHMGIRLIRLNVSGAFHCELMSSALPDFTNALKELKRKGGIRKTRAPVIANTTAKPISTPDEIEKELIDHVTMPVLWKETIDFLEAGVDSTVEFGKKATLSNMMKNKGAIVGVAAGIGLAAGVATFLYFRSRQSKKETS